MKEGYLQLKIRELGEKLDKIELKHEKLLSEINNMTMKIEPFKEIVQNLEQFKNILTQQVRKIVIEEYQGVYDDIANDLITKSDNAIEASNKRFEHQINVFNGLIKQQFNFMQEYVRKVETEIALERRDISKLLSLLIHKKVVTNHEVSEITANTKDKIEEFKKIAHSIAGMQIEFFDKIKPKTFYASGHEDCNKKEGECCD